MRNAFYLPKITKCASHVSNLKPQSALFNDKFKCRTQINGDVICNLSLRFHFLLTIYRLAETLNTD